MFRPSPPPVNDERMFKLEELLDLTYNDKLKFWRIFKKYKTSTSQVSVRQFYKFCGVNDFNNQFVDGIFRLCDCGSDHSLIFSEFVAAVTTYCMFEKSHMHRYCFFAFDTDGNGFIDKEEIKQLEECLFHDGHKYGNTKTAWKKALHNADANKDGMLDFDEFNTMLSNNPMMLYPAWQMQTNMMTQILGQNWWKDRRHKLATRRKKAKKNEERAFLLAEKRRMRRLKHEHIHRIGRFRYYLAPIIQWVSRRFRRMRNRRNRNSNMPIENNLTSPTKNNQGGVSNLKVNTKRNKNAVHKFARTFSLSPQKQVIRSVYSNGIEKVLRDKDGGTPKVIKWSDEINRQEELEQEIETDRSNGLHRSGHWNPRKLNKLKSYSKNYRKNFQNHDDIAVKEDDNSSEDSSSGSSNEAGEEDMLEDHTDPLHLKPQTGIYDYSNPNPITRVSSLDEKEEQDEEEGYIKSASTMRKNINYPEKMHLSPLRTLSTNNTYNKFSSPFQQKNHQQPKLFSSNMDRLYNLHNHYNNQKPTNIISESNCDEYTSVDENGIAVYNNSGSLRQ
jgi:Ca2+-binding EF-hand superfamily protein